MTRHVAVNLTWVAPGRVGGSEEYLVRQLAGFSDEGFDLELVATDAFFSAHPDLARRFVTRVAPLRRDHRGLRIGLEHTWLAAVTRHADLVHHGGGTVPLVGPRPVVVTVHDLQYLEFPQYFTAARRRYLDTMMPRSIRRAAVVTTPTEFVRSTVITAFDADPARVVVVPHGVPDITVADGRIAEVRRRHGVDRPYVVYPAITHPHKGHLVLVEMLDHLADTDLVLIGGAGAVEERVAAAAGRAGHRVVRTGRVSADDRDALLAGSDALVFPSEYEGFGAPLVEAMVAGVPVVCSDAGAVREVVGDAGVVVTRRDGASWADAVRDARARRDELVARGRVRRREFDLSTSGAALARAYRLASEVGGAA